MNLEIEMLPPVRPFATSACIVAKIRKTTGHSLLEKAREKRKRLIPKFT
jgi:hypothetical protein